MTNSTALTAQTEQRQPVASHSGVKISSMELTTMDDIYRLAQTFAASGITPKTYGNNADKVFVGIIAGAEVGFAPMQALQSIAVINGMPAIWGDGALALVQASGLLEDIDETDDGNKATCTVKRVGRSKPVTQTFSMEDAKAAGLLSKEGPWKTYPRRMRQMRARSWAIRDAFPDVLKGLHIAEEAQDIPVAPGTGNQPQRISSAMLAEQAGATVDQPEAGAADDLWQRMEKGVDHRLAEERVQDAEVEDIAAETEQAAAAAQTLADIDGPLDQAEGEAEPDTKIDPFSPGAPWAAKVAEIKAAMDKAQTVIDLNAVPLKFKADLDVMPQVVRDSLSRQKTALMQALKDRQQT